MQLFGLTIHADDLLFPNDGKIIESSYITKQT
jgi:hypothetical protein